MSSTFGHHPADIENLDRGIFGSRGDESPLDIKRSGSAGGFMGSDVTSLVGGGFGGNGRHVGFELEIQGSRNRRRQRVFLLFDFLPNSDRRHFQKFVGRRATGMSLDHVGEIDGDGRESVVKELRDNHSIKLLSIFITRSHILVFVFGRRDGGGVIVGGGGVWVSHARGADAGIPGVEDGRTVATKASVTGAATVVDWLDDEGRFWRS